MLQIARIAQGIHYSYSGEFWLYHDLRISSQVYHAEYDYYLLLEDHIRHWNYRLTPLYLDVVISGDSCHSFVSIIFISYLSTRPWIAPFLFLSNYVDHYVSHICTQFNRYYLLEAIQFLDSKVSLFHYQKLKHWYQNDIKFNQTTNVQPTHQHLF